MLQQNTGLGFAWIPFIIATSVATGASIVPAWMSLNRQSNAQKSNASNTADDVERKMQELNRAYFALQNRTSQQKNEALAYFNQLWNELVSICPQFGNAGARCIEERKQGGRFDWFKAYREPIEQDVVNDDVASGITEQLTNATSGYGPVIAGLAIVAGLYLVTKK